MGKTPKYQLIRNQILEQIENGTLRPGDRLPVRSDMIEQYAVTRTTLDKALNELINSGILISSKRGGTCVAEAPQKRRSIAVISRLQNDVLASHLSMPNDVQRMFASIILTATDRADVRFLDDGAVSQDLQQLLEFDAAIWVQPDDQCMQSLEPYADRVYITNRYVDQLRFASTNHRQAIREVTEFYINLLDLDDAVDIYYIGTAHQHFIRSERRAGFVEACAAHNRFYRDLDVQLDADDCFDALMSLPINPDKTNIIIAISSILEPAILAMATERGLHRGQNFFYADCDNDSIAQGHRPAALTVTQDYPAMGRAVVEAAINGDDCRAFIPHLIKGSRHFDI